MFPALRAVSSLEPLPSFAASWAPAPSGKAVVPAARDSEKSTSRNLLRMIISSFVLCRRHPQSGFCVRRLHLERLQRLRLQVSLKLLGVVKTQRLRGGRSPHITEQKPFLLGKCCSVGELLTPRFFRPFRQ